MGKYIIRRLLQLIPILLLITFLSFGMMRLAGSDAVLQKSENTGVAVSQEMIDSARAELGLDKPFLTQYFVWLSRLIHGDMGTSYISGRDVFSTFISKLPATLLLTLVTILLTVIISVPLGILSAVYQNKLTDRVIRAASFFRKQYAEFLCCTSTYLFLRYSPRVVLGHIKGSEPTKCVFAVPDARFCDVGKIPKTGAFSST